MATSSQSLHRQSVTSKGSVSSDDFQWNPIKSADINAVFAKMTDVTSWWSHATSTGLVFVLALILMLAFRPPIIMTTTDDGVSTDNIAFPKFFGLAFVAAAVAFGIGLGLNGVPSIGKGSEHNV